MLRIRLTRTGKKRQPSFRIVVAEHSKAVKRQYLELLGQYIPAAKDKLLKLNKERIEYWLSKGAQPSDTMAVILKKEGFAKMDRFIGRRDLQRTKKKDAKAEGGTEEGAGEKAEGAKDAAPAKDAAAPAEAKTDEPSKKDEAPPEAPKEETKVEEPAKKEKPTEEAPKEEAAAA